MISSSAQKALLALAVGLTGAIAILSPQMLEHEEELGLHWLFALRGAVEGPAGVAVVSIDNESARAFGLPLATEDWPRSLHANAVQRLHAAGAAVIVFDISFKEPRDDTSEDEAFASAMRAAGNVLLLDWLASESVDAAGGSGRFEIEERELPIPPLAAAALGTAPFPLPVVDPSRTSQFWVFGRIDSGVLTLPAAALHAHALEAHDDLLRLIELARPGSTASLPKAADISPETKLTNAGRDVRALFVSDRELAPELATLLENGRDAIGSDDASGRRRTLVERLIQLYGGANSRYLNYYGPSRTIQTIPYHRLLSMENEDLRRAVGDKVVFVGFSELRSERQQDDFPTVFSERETGAELGGVEIAATAYANLRDARFVLPVAMPLQPALLLVWGSALASALLWLPTRLGVTATLLAGPAYVLLASALLRANGTWLPLITPVLGQLPLALIGAFALKYAQARRQEDSVWRALEIYLPKRALHGPARRIETAHPASQLLHGTCLVTDAQNYTALAERLPPRELQQALNAYYGVLFPEVERRDGFVADVVGDSMVAIWATAEPDDTARLNACRAALAIEQSTRAFNAANPGFELPTRIGLHSGQILLGDIGTASRLEYRAIGDIVNTASRIQHLNKQLRTTLLVSDEVLQNVGPVSCRQLGKFVLAGKEIPVSLCDRISFAPAVDSEESALLADFATARRLFLDRRWRDASAAFEAILVRFPADGPTGFFRELCRLYDSNDPGPAWTGIVTAALPQV